MNSRRLIVTLYVVFLAAFGLGSGALFLDARAEYRQLKLKEAENRLKLAQAEVRLLEQDRILERLRTDPQFVEKVLRKRLGYARPGEMIFRFED